MNVALVLSTAVSFAAIGALLAAGGAAIGVLLARRPAQVGAHLASRIDAFADEHFCAGLQPNVDCTQVWNGRAWTVSGPKSATPPWSDVQVQRRALNTVGAHRVNACVVAEPQPATASSSRAAQATRTTAATFGPYRLEAMLGQGAMGEVWRAFDTRRQRHVALKLVPNHSEVPAAAHERMQREAQVAGCLSSAHVVPIHDFGWVEGEAFLDMRLVSGGDLARLLRTHPKGLEPLRAARIVTQIADALDAAHSAGLVHCDVKPSNVLLERTATGDFCYLADFGIATLTRARRHSSAASAPTDAAIAGTPVYMAPELFAVRDANRASVASDIYALAVLSYELLTGQPPFLGTDLRALRYQHTHQHPPLVSKTQHAVVALDSVLAQALDKNPERRHRSAGAFAAAVTAALTFTSQTTTNRSAPAAPNLDDLVVLTAGRNEVTPRLAGANVPDPALRSASDSLDAVFLPSLVCPGQDEPLAA